MCIRKVFKEKVVDGFLLGVLLWNYCPSNICQYWSRFWLCGAAVSKHLRLGGSSMAISEHWFGWYSSDENNSLISTAPQVKSDLQPHKLVMTSDIPWRVVSSSEFVIVAGIELANNGRLAAQTMINLILRPKFEGSPDNAAPSYFRNLVVASLCGRTC